MYVIRNTCSVIPRFFFCCVEKFISVVIFFNLANTIQLALSASGSEMRKPFVCIETFPLTTSSNNGLSHFRMRAYQCAGRGDIFVQQKQKIFTKKLGTVCICLFDERQLCKAGVILERERSEADAGNCF